MDDPSGHEMERPNEDIAARIVRASAELEALVAEAATLGSQGDDAIDSGLGGDGPEASDELAVRAQSSKAAMAQMRSQAARFRSQIEAKKGELENLMRAQLAKANEVLGPLQKLTKRLEEGIEAINLYMGRDEDVVALRAGKPSPADVPITVRQMVLSMAEECAVAAEVGGIDATSIAEFDAWLLEDPAHLDQVLPEDKAVVALVPTFHNKDYGDPWATKAIAERNAITYFLIRNGERLFRATAEFSVGTRLVPARDEFTSFFYERHRNYETGQNERTEIRPGSAAWARAEEGADARRRHFLKVGLTLQGLLDRHTVLAPLPPGGVDLLHETSYDAGLVNIVTDGENALETGGETFSQWQERINSELRVGMRIIGAFSSSEFNGERYERRYGNPRLRPYAASYPESGAIYCLEDRRDDGFVFRYKRSDKVWSKDPRNWGEHDPKQRASCTVYPNDRFILAYDLARVEDMERFIRSRASRHDYVSMFPVLKAAIKAKRAEAAEEAPFRQMLAGQVATTNGVGVPEAEAEVAELVEWWKFANRYHRPLVGDDEAQAKAVKAIVAEHARRERGRQRQGDSALVAELRGMAGAVLVARKPDGDYVALLACDEKDVFVTEVTLTPRGRRTEVAWKLPGARPNRWRTLWESPRWAKWDRAASLSDHLTGPELDAFVDEALGSYKLDNGVVDPKVLVVTYREQEPRGSVSKSRRLTIWTFDSEGRWDDAHLLTGEFSSPQVKERAFVWKRSTGQKVVVEGKDRRSGWAHPWDRDDPWRHEPVIFRNEAGVVLADAAHQRYKDFERAKSALWTKLSAAFRSVESAWVERATAVAYQRFLEDYGDIELWDGHKKTLNIRYPHSHNHGYSHWDDGLTKLLKRLVEDGVDLSGLTVADGVALGADRYGETFGVPEDIMDLPLGSQEREQAGPKGVDEDGTSQA